MVGRLHLCASVPIDPPLPPLLPALPPSMPAPSEANGVRTIIDDLRGLVITTPEVGEHIWQAVRDIKDRMGHAFPVDTPNNEILDVFYDEVDQLVPAASYYDCY